MLCAPAGQPTGTLLTTKAYSDDAAGRRLAMTNTPAGQSQQGYTYAYEVHGSVSLL